MNLSLYIKSSFIESRQLDMEGIELIDQRERIVQEQAAYLRHKFMRDLLLAGKEWEIILTAKSKMNELQCDAGVERKADC